MKSSSSNLAILIKYLNDTKNEYTKKIDFGLTEKKIIHELYSGKNRQQRKVRINSSNFKKQLSATSNTAIT
jgi:hypothetical protein